MSYSSLSVRSIRWGRKGTCPSTYLSGISIIDGSREVDEVLVFERFPRDDSMSCTLCLGDDGLDAS